VVVAEIAFVRLIRMVVVLHPAVSAVPITSEITLSIVMRRNPVRSHVGRASPIAVMPHVAATDWVPITIHPGIIRTRSYGPNHYPWRRRSANSDSD
jgi:hypothetical protein